MILMIVESLPGDNICQVAKEMWRVSNILTVLVECRFNDTRIYCRPGQDYPGDMVERWRRNRPDGE